MKIALGPGWRGRPALAACAFAALLAAALGGDLAGGAVRALALLGALGAGAAALAQGQAKGRAPALVVEERHALGKECGLALVTAPGRRLLVAFSASGVHVLERLDAAREIAP